MVGNLTTSSNSFQGQVFSNSFIDLTGTSQVNYAIGGLPTNSLSVSFTYPSPAHITGILKTPMIFYSTENGASTVSVLYSVSDAVGRTQCSPTGVTVRLTVGTAFSACSVFASSASPYGTCTLVVAPAMFSALGSSLAVSVALSVNAAVVESKSLGDVVLAPIPAQSTPSAAGIYFQMPIYVAVPGDTVTVPMWAQTGGSDTMESWSVSLVYNSSLFTLVGVTHPLYPTVFTNTAVPNALSITGTGGSGAISGWFQAATISFSVTASAAGVTIQMSMPAVASNSMTNSVPITCHRNFAGLFADSRGGWTFTSGQLSVLLPTVVGLYGYSTQSSFVNTFLINGRQSTDVMKVMASYNTGRTGAKYTAYGDVAVQPSSCLVLNSAVVTASISTSGCSVSLSQNGGGSSVIVTASYNGLNTSVAYRFFYFVRYSLNTTRTQLRRLGCNFESAYLSAYGDATLDGVTSLATVDLSSIVTFTSGNSSVLGVIGRLATGLKVGTASVTYGSPSALAVYNFIVSNGGATVIKLVSYSYSSSFASPTAVSGTELSTALVRLQTNLTLQSEQDTAFVVTYAMDDDGVWTDVSAYSTLTLTSNDASNLAVNRTATGWLLSVPVGATSSTSSTPLISGKLTDSCGSVLTSSGYGYVTSGLPAPISIVVTATSVSVARPGTPAATVIGLPTSTQLTVTVTYRSSAGVLSTQDFTSDARSVYTASFTQATGSVSSSGLVSLSSSVGAGLAGSVTIVVTLPTYQAAAGLNGSLTIPVVDVNSLVPLSGLLIHTSTGATVPVTAATPLRKVACTGTKLLDF